MLSNVSDSWHGSNISGKAVRSGGPRYMEYDVTCPEAEGNWDSSTVQS